MLLDYNFLIPTSGDWQLTDYRSDGDCGGQASPATSTQNVVLVLAAILVIVWRTARRPQHNLPPGPKGLPVVGCLPFLSGENGFAKILSIARQYSGAFSIRIGTRPVVFLNDWPTIKANIVEKSDVFSGQPQTITFQKEYDQNEMDVCDGPIVREQMRSIQHQLRKKSLNQKVTGQVETVIKILSDRCGNMKTTTVNVSNVFASFSDNRSMDTLVNLFQGDMDTTGNTISWLMLYMATCPQIQSKVAKELDDVIGSHRLPVYEDKSHLAYTEAVILEAERLSTPVPFGIPHAPLKSVQVNGFTLPKGTCTLQNIYGVHHDAKLWGDPQVFRPERFLDESGVVRRPEYFIPYAAGPQSGLNESLASVELFLFFSRLMQKFTFNHVTGVRRPRMTPLLTATLRPPPFSLQVTSRC